MNQTNASTVAPPAHTPLIRAARAFVDKDAARQVQRRMVDATDAHRRMSRFAATGEYPEGFDFQADLSMVGLGLDIGARLAG